MQLPSITNAGSMVYIWGYATDPKWRTDRAGALTSVLFSVPETYTTKDGKDVANWNGCRAWGKTAEILKDRGFDKGSKIVCVGKLATEKWPNKNGETDDKTIVQISTIFSLENKVDRPVRSNDAPAPAANDLNEAYVDPNDSDLPF